MPWKTTEWQATHRSSCVCLGETGRQGWVQLERSYQPASQPEEPADPSALEDLVIELLEPVTGENNDDD